MFLNQVKKKNPKAFQIFADWLSKKSFVRYYIKQIVSSKFGEKDFDIRDLYDFFEENGIRCFIIDCPRSESKFSYDILIKDRDEWYEYLDYEDESIYGIENRISAEEKCFQEAFDLFEDLINGEVE